MSGRRCKALRKQFEAKHGRVPNKALWTAPIAKSKKLGHKVLRWLQMTVDIRSEWRRLKKAYVRGIDAQA